MPSPQVDAPLEQNDASTRPKPMSFCHGPRVRCPFPTVTAAFYHQVCTNGSSIATKDLSGLKTREITYSELCRSVSFLRVRLLSVGVKPGDRIPLVVKRSTEMLIGLLAILCCGAQYVPLDGSVVPDRTLQIVLEQCGGEVVVCMSATKHRLHSKPVTCIVIEEHLTELDTHEQTAQPEWGDLARREDGCYVIYTSGTTGVPKGVNVSHANVTNLVCLSPGNLSIKKGMKVGQVLNVSFDMAAWEILACLCNGGTLVLRGSKWEETLKEVDVLICTPSILTKYDPGAYPNIKITATAGEPSNVRLADSWSTNGRTYYNCCGPTETTIVNTMHKHVMGGPLTIGKPTANNSVYILDENLDHVSIGAVGVMWAGGTGVSRGYLELPEKTAEKYLSDKFISDGTMMYNTGDLGRWREDGEIDIIGRVDDQVKVKGFRVELDGVSASLASAPGVQKAVALLIDGEIHGFISPAYVELKEAQDYMTKCQPYYAIPSKLTTLEAFPLTNNGKVDKHALRDAAATQESRSATKAREPNYDASLSTGSGSSTPDLKTSLSPTSSLSDLGEKPDLFSDLPNKDLPRHIRGLRHRAFIVYRRLFSLVGLLNMAALALIFAAANKGEWLSTLTAINLVVAVLVRQDFVINGLYTIACSVPKSFPLSIRARCGKIYHLGGVHSGAAVCASAWLLTSNISATVCRSPQCEGLPRQSLATQVMSWILTGLFAVMLGSAWPSLRKAHHDLFERLHRFVGWTMLVIFWIRTMLSVNDNRYRGQSLSDATARTPGFWLLLLATCSIATSWLFLRKVPVAAEVLSDHAVRLHFGYTVPVNGSFTRLSRRPLLEWHSFATIPAPDAIMSYPKGYSLVVSNAGDWTQSCIKRPPSHIWVRGVPTCGVMRIATLYRRIVLIATGSGIGPVLGHIQSPSCPTQLIWSTSRPEVTFGKIMVDTIRRQIPGAVIHDTKTQGRPDLVKMGYNLATSFEAEAVIIIANEKITKKIVYGLETRGINAYGAIWDS